MQVGLDAAGNRVEKQGRVFPGAVYLLETTDPETEAFEQRIREGAAQAGIKSASASKNSK